MKLLTSIGLKNVALISMGPALNRKEVLVAVISTANCWAAWTFGTSAAPRRRYEVPSTFAPAYNSVMPYKSLP